MDAFTDKAALSNSAFSRVDEANDDVREEYSEPALTPCFNDGKDALDMLSDG